MRLPISADPAISHTETRSTRRKTVSGISVLVAFWLLPTVSPAASPLEIWPAEGPPTAPLVRQMEAIDAAAAGLPQALQPAVRFQKLFLKILSGAKPGEWRGEMEAFCNPPAGAPLAAGMCEVARVWIARAQMDEIDAALRGYYRRNIRFPATLAELGAPLPKDPWGEDWSYTPLAPQGFSKLADQRYQLGPARFPKLAPLAESLRGRKPQAHAWSITPREVAGKTALEFRAGQTLAVIQPGGVVEGCTLLFIGEQWALLAGRDGLFAVAF